MTEELADSIARARALVSSATRITVLTGAGISTDSGIPDFRGPQGVWTKNPEAEKLATLQHYLADPEVRRRAWQNRLHSTHWAAEPNHGHRTLVALESSGRMLGLVTQNVDGLHQLAGSDPERVVEVHGTMRYSRCWDCGDRLPMAEVLVRVREGEADPPCRECGGILKSDTISFGQSLVPEVIDQAMFLADTCDLLLAVGTSLQVYPVANMVPRARSVGAAIVIVNGEATKMDRFADVVLRGPIAELLPRLVERSDLP
ncbi:MAG: Sir2 family NAD-dependent protein deacetylase [Ilumatobacteraceae bacterium]